MKTDIHPAPAWPQSYDSLTCQNSATRPIFFVSHTCFPSFQMSRILTQRSGESYGISLWSNIEPGMGIVAGNLATMRPILQRVVANTTRFTNSLRTRQGHNSPKQGSKNAGDPLHSEAVPSVTRPAGAHIDHNYPQRRDDSFAFLRRADPKDVEYGVHVWHSDSKEELVDINGDVEMGGSIFQKSELIVREETIDTLPSSPNK